MFNASPLRHPPDVACAGSSEHFAVDTQWSMVDQAMGLSTSVLSFSKISSIADIQRCFEFRTNLESRAAGLAATRRTAGQLGRIIAAAEKIDEANRLHSIASEEDFEFHLAIATASHNQYYSTVMMSLRANIEEGMNITRTLSLQSADNNRMTLVQNEHHAILKCIIDGDAANAESAMETHLNNARVRMFEGTHN